MHNLVDDLSNCVVTISGLCVFGCVASMLRTFFVLHKKSKEENKMKKVLALILALVLVLSLAACGGNSTKESITGKTSSQAETTEEVQETEQAPQEKVDVPESLVGTWYLLPYDFFDFMYSPSANEQQSIIKYENAIKEFTISDNGTITVDGKDYFLKSSSGESFELPDPLKTLNEQFTVEIDKYQYRICLNSDSEYIAYIAYGNAVSQYNPIYSKQKYSD